MISHLVKRLLFLCDDQEENRPLAVVAKATRLQICYPVSLGGNLWVSSDTHINALILFRLPFSSPYASPTERVHKHPLQMPPNSVFKEFKLATFAKKQICIPRLFSL